MTRTTTRATTRARRNTENPPGDPSQPSENFTQADPPGSDNAHRQDTTEGPTGNLREGTDQRDRINCPAQAPTEAPPHMARTPQAIGNYGLGARLPGSFTGGAEPTEDSPLTEKEIAPAIIEACARREITTPSKSGVFTRCLKG